eukprot:Opistho-2@80055
MVVVVVTFALAIACSYRVARPARTHGQRDEFADVTPRHLRFSAQFHVAHTNRALLQRAVFENDHPGYARLTTASLHCVNGGRVRNIVCHLCPYVGAPQLPGDENAVVNRCLTDGTHKNIRAPYVFFPHALGCHFHGGNLAEVNYNPDSSRGAQSRGGRAKFSNKCVVAAAVRDNIATCTPSRRTGTVLLRVRNKGKDNAAVQIGINEEAQVKEHGLLKAKCCDKLLKPPQIPQPLTHLGKGSRRHLPRRQKAHSFGESVHVPAHRDKLTDRIGHNRTDTALAYEHVSRLAPAHVHARSLCEEFRDGGVLGRSYAARRHDGGHEGSMVYAQSISALFEQTKLRNHLRCDARHFGVRDQTGG